MTALQIWYAVSYVQFSLWVGPTLGVWRRLGREGEQRIHHQANAPATALAFALRLWVLLINVPEITESDLT